MKLAWSFGITAAVVFHGAVLLFGGILFMDRDKDAGSHGTVELVSDLDTVEEKKKPEDEPEKPAQESEELATEEETPPDAAEILRNLDVSPLDSAPALEEASLGAIDAALSGIGGGGDFADALSFASGGRIGGTGKAGEMGVDMEQAFSLAEIDQKPRVIFQESPVIPSEMRGKKTEGVVYIAFVVDAAGRVVSPRVEKSSHPAFEAPALDAIKKWKFEPGVRAGQRVPSKMKVNIHFPQG